MNWKVTTVPVIYLVFALSTCFASELNGNCNVTKAQLYQKFWEYRYAQLVRETNMSRFLSPALSDENATTDSNNLISIINEVYGYDIWCEHSLSATLVLKSNIGLDRIDALAYINFEVSDKGILINNIHYLPAVFETSTKQIVEHFQ